MSTLFLASLLCVCALAQSGPGAVPLACNAKAISAAERPRYKELVGSLKAAVKERRELPDGYSFRLDNRAVALQDVAEWMSMERRCCPFLTFQLETSGSQADSWLTLKGPSGVKAILDAELAFQPK